jgi:hypothetical protein
MKMKYKMCLYLGKGLLAQILHDMPRNSCMANINMDEIP